MGDGNLDIYDQHPKKVIQYISYSTCNQQKQVLV